MNIWIGLGSIDRVTTGSIIWTTFLSWSRKPLIVHILLPIFQLFCIFTCLYEFYRVISSPLLLSLCNKALLLRAVLKRVPTFEGTFLTLWVPIYFSCHKQWLWKGPQLRTWSSWGPNCWNGPHWSSFYTKVLIFLWRGSLITVAGWGDWFVILQKAIQSMHALSYIIYY